MDFQKIIFIYLIFINVCGFFLMGIDKQKAKKHLWRIPEKSLFLAAVLGGSIGSVLGMYTFRHKTKKTIFVIGMPVILALQIIAVCMLLFASSGPAEAEDMAAFLQGDGTQGNPYIITNKYQFDAIRNNLSAHYRLDSDISFSNGDFLSGGDFYTEGTGFQAFGSHAAVEDPLTYRLTEDEPDAFTGSLDGNGHRISGLSWYVEDSGSMTRFFKEAGLFAKCSGTVKNLSLVNINAHISSVERCTFGGIASYVMKGAVIENCTVSGRISVESYAVVGGIAGEAKDDEIYGFSVPTIEKCTNHTDISVNLSNTEKRGSGVTAGGILGFGGGVKDCKNGGAISGTGKGLRLGGIAGGGVRIDQCYNTGRVQMQVSAPESDQTRENQAGGICGTLDAGIYNCYNTGKISGTDFYKTGSNYVGGLVGRFYTSVKIVTCYNVGDVVLEGESGRITPLGNSGGLCGTDGGSSETVSVNSYYINANLDAFGSLSGNLRNTRLLTEEQFREASNFTGFDFGSIWEMGSGSYGYPCLQSNPHDFLGNSMEPVSTATPLPTVAPSSTPAATSSPTPTATPVSTPSESPSPSASQVPTATPVPSASQIPDLSTPSPETSGDIPQNTSAPGSTAEPLNTASPDASGWKDGNTAVPFVSPTVTPETSQSPEGTKTPEVTGTPRTVTPVPSEAIQQTEKNKWEIASFRAKDSGSETITLRWSVLSGNQNVTGKKVFIYRAIKKKGTYQRIRTTAKNRYTDKKVQAGKIFYYKLRISGQKKFSMIRKVRLLYKKPTVKLSKRRTEDGKKYLQFRVKSWRGNRIEISFKKGKGSYKKVKLKNNLLSRKKHLYNLLYTGKNQTFTIKIRTIGRRKGKKVYSNGRILRIKV